MRSYNNGKELFCLDWLLRLLKKYQNESAHATALTGLENRGLLPPCEGGVCCEGSKINSRALLPANLASAISVAPATGGEVGWPSLVSERSNM